jgi:hypothetical protein
MPKKAVCGMFYGLGAIYFYIIIYKVFTYNKNHILDHYYVEKKERIEKFT